MKTVQLCDSYIDTYDKILTLIFESLDHQLSDINKLWVMDNRSSCLECKIISLYFAEVNAVNMLLTVSVR